MTVPSFVSDDDREPIVTISDAGGCERQVVYSDLVLEEPPPFDVVIVADNSGSISWSRDDLSAGLSTLLDEVHGRNVRFFVLTPTQYGADSALLERTTGLAPVQHSDPATGQPYSPAMTTYSQRCTDLLGVDIDCPSSPDAPPAQYVLNGTFDFFMPPPVAAITQDMTHSEIAEQQRRIADAVLELGATGAPYEQPLCTLGRYVSQPEGLLPERVVFVVISDEDDVSDPKECLTGYELERRSLEDAPPPSCSDCKVMRYYASSSYVQPRTEYRCVPTDDTGQPLPELAVESFVSYSAAAACDREGNECDEQELATVARYCGAGVVIEKCEHVCADEVAGCTLELPEDVTDACSQPFTHLGVPYDNHVEYCNQRYQWGDFGDCVSMLSDPLPADATSPTLHSFPRPRTLLTGTSNVTLPTSALADHFVDGAEAAFGTGNYFVESIVFDERFACAPRAGQSPAPLLASVASSEDDVFAICDAYAPALQRINAFAQSSLRTEYPLKLRVRETIEAVVITDVGGGTRSLASTEYEYDDVASVLRLQRDAITGADRSLNVELAVHCGPVR